MLDCLEYLERSEKVKPERWYLIVLRFHRKKSNKFFLIFMSIHSFYKTVLFKKTLRYCFSCGEQNKREVLQCHSRNYQPLYLLVPAMSIKKKSFETRAGRQTNFVFCNELKMSDGFDRHAI